MFTVKIACLLFAAGVALDSSIPCFYRVPAIAAAIVLFSVLNGTKTPARGRKPTCRHGEKWGLYARSLPAGEWRLTGDIEFICESCGYRWEGKAEPGDGKPNFVSAAILTAEKDLLIRSHMTH